MTQLLTNPMIDALGWTLLHSLWQVSFAALVLYMLLRIKRAKSPVFRYNIAASTLIVIFGLAICTFIYEYDQSSTAPAASPASEQLLLTQAQVLSLIHAAPATIPDISGFSTFKQNVISLVSNHTPTLAMLWLLGVFMLTIRFLGGIAYTFRLKHHARNTVHQEWQQRARALSNSLDLKQPIKVVTSHIVKVPLVVGYFKPVVLFPFAIVSGLPTEQLEMILAHEIAHVYRKDHWVNLLQSVAEIVLFYHPAIWWISSVIRTEREYCCDDIALRLTGNTLTYAKALVKLEESREAMTGLALAATGQKGSLFQRIERILDPTVQRSGSNKVLASLIIVAVIFTAGSSLALSNAAWLKDSKPLSGIFSHAQTNTEFEVSESTSPKEATVEKQEISEDHTNGNEGNAVITADYHRQAALYAPDHDSGGSTLHSANLDILWGEMPLRTADTLPDQFTMRFSSDDEADVNFRVDIPDAPNTPNFSFSFSSDSVPHFTFSDSIVNLFIHPIDSMMNVLGEKFEDPALQEEIERAMHEIQRSLAHLQDSIDYDRIREEAKMHEKAMKAHSKALEKQAEMLRERAEEIEEKAELMAERAREKAKHERFRNRNYHRNFESSTHMLERELRQDGFITAGKQYKFDIKKGQLKINGKKQPEKLYEKYADLLENEMNISVEEGHRGRGSNFSLVKEPYAP